MPPRSPLTSSFSVADASNEVVCPLRNQDGSSCRKRCLGEKRYRSMQEHIRRAHPEHYISKLPATEESFTLMINTPPSERPRESTARGIAPAREQPAPRPPPPPPPPPPPSRPLPLPNITDSQREARNDIRGVYDHENPAFAMARSSSPMDRRPDEPMTNSMLPAASAAAALAQLHNHKMDSPWDSEQDSMPEIDPNQRAATSVELPGIAQMKKEAGLNYPPFDRSQPRQLLPSILSRSPPGRSSTLPPIQRRDKPARPRKSSITQNSRKSQHERKRSKGDTIDHIRSISGDGRKAFSAEPTGPTSAYGKRWEDLIDAATTATEEADDDRTPIPHSSPTANRASLPPFPTAHYQSYHASPLQHTVTPPPSYGPGPEPFPSVEGGDSFPGESQSSPSSSSQNVQIYCASCPKIAPLLKSFACTECICGICRECVDVLMGEQGAQRRCPKCGTIGGRFKPFQLDIR